MGESPEDSRIESLAGSLRMTLLCSALPSAIASIVGVFTKWHHPRAT